MYSNQVGGYFLVYLATILIQIKGEADLLVYLVTFVIRNMYVENKREDAFCEGCF